MLNILHISDIHFNDDHRNPAVTKAKEIADCFVGIVDPSATNIVIVTGDIAYHGREEEYLIAKTFFRSLRDELGRHGEISCLLFVPGNHDCNFKAETQARSRLVDSCSGGRESPDGSVIEICAEVQREFALFSESESVLSSACEIVEKNRFSSTVRLEVNGSIALIRLVNSAWCSKIKERPGSLVSSLPKLKQVLGEKRDGTLLITAMHHPFSWFNPEQKNAIRRLVEEESDVVLTGHEHDPNFTRKYSYPEGSIADFSQGGALQFHGDADRSAFNVIRLDPAGKYMPMTATWVGEKSAYRRVAGESWRDFVRFGLERRLSNQVSTNFLEFLQEVGSPLTHPAKSGLTLQDIFVYPDFQEVSLGESEKIGGLVRGENILNRSVEGARVILAGEDLSGKTSLAKMLFLDLHKIGHIPVFLDGRDLGKSGHDWVKGKIERSFQSQYRRDREDLWGIGEESRILIVDNYEAACEGPKGRRSLTAIVSQYFKRVILITGGNMILEEIAQSGAKGQKGASNEEDEGASPLLEFAHFRILDWGRSTISQVVERWMDIGEHPYGGELEFQKKVTATERILSMLFNSPNFPVKPIFVLSAIQTLSQGQGGISSGKGSFGFIYESLIASRLSSCPQRIENLATKFNYLASLAYYMIVEDLESMPEHDLEEWHGRHTKSIMESISFSGLWDDLLDSGLVERKGAALQFKYGFVFSYFVARYMARRLDKSSVVDLFDRLCGNLGREDYSNVVLFLCHLSSSELVLSRMLELVNGAFDNVKEAGLEEAFYLDHVGPERFKIESAVAPSGSGHSERRRKQFDSADSDHAESNGLLLANDESGFTAAREARAKLAEIAANEGAEQLLVVNRVIFMIGQILRNFHSDVEGDTKIALCVGSQRLVKRVVGWFFEFLAKFGKPLRADILTFIQHSTNLKTEGDQRSAAARLLFLLIENHCFGWTKHLAEAVGFEELGLVHREMLHRRPSGVTDQPSSFGLLERICDVAFDLEQLGPLDEGALKTLFEDAKDNLLAKVLIQHLVWYRFYHYPEDVGVRQRVCTLVGIESSDARLISGRGRKVETRGRGSSAAPRRFSGSRYGRGKKKRGKR